MFKLIRHISSTVISCVFLMTFCSSDIRAQSAETNTRWILKEMMPALDSILTAHKVKNLFVEFSAPDEVNTLLEAELIRSGYILFDEPKDGMSITKVTIVPNLVLSYQKTSRNEGLRKLKGNISVQLTNASGVLDVSELLVLNNAQKLTGEYSKYEDGLWSMSRFTEVKMSRLSDSFKKILEPALIIATVGVTVFLLFNVRTQ